MQLHHDSNRKINTRDIALLGFLLGVALILSYIESLVPFFFGVPGMKLGLANMAIVLIMFRYGPWQAFLINVMRIVISGFLFGSLFGILFSFSGAVISFFVMLIFKKLNLFTIRGVSVLGGVTHNIAQALCAAYIVRTSGILYYVPALIIVGAMTGYLNGYIADHVYAYLTNHYEGEL